MDPDNKATGPDSTTTEPESITTEPEDTQDRKAFTKKLAVTLGIIFIIVAAAVAILVVFKPFQSDAARFYAEYPLAGKNHIYVYRNASETADILENGTGLVFIGFPACPWCQRYVEMLQGVALGAGIKEIYYCDVYKDRDKDTTQYRRLVELLGPHLELDSNGNPRIYVPDFTVVKNGSILGHDNETSTLSGITPEEYWTADKVFTQLQKLEEMVKSLN